MNAGREFDTGRPKVAIVGGGIAGLTAALGLQDVCEVTVFEADRLGGHILPVSVSDPAGQPAFVDTGFVVFVPSTYPRFTRMLECLEVAHEPAATRFRITDDLRGLSFEPGDLMALCGREIPFECRRDLTHLFGILRSVRHRGLDAIENISMEDWLIANRYRVETIELGVLPWIASFWGLQSEDVLSFSARVALREIARIAGPYKMHRVVPSTKYYLDRLLGALDQTTFASVRVERVTTAEGPHIETSADRLRFDHVVLAVRAETARELLVDAPTARATLANVPYASTVAVVHRDTSDLPEDHKLWRTFHHRRRADGDRTRSVTTWILDFLHAFRADGAKPNTPWLLTTGDPGLLDHALIDPSQIVTTFRHRHLVQTPAMVNTLATLGRIDEGQAFTLAGSYCALGGLHEEALGSGLRAANKVRRELALGPLSSSWATDAP